ncbi:MAG: hypothetical protein OXE53_19080 [Deltaproteobacteria bacterium]|nr:hypothetical protein [Deltaproteobacteria bacterium]
MSRQVFVAALTGLLIFAGCTMPVQEPTRTATCEALDGDAGQMADNRTISISSLSGCTLTTVIGANIDYDFVSPLRDVRISWIPSGTSKTDASESTRLTVSGTVAGPPENRSVRVWYGTKSLLFTWKVERTIG